MVTGTIADWSCISQLHQITAPTLVYNAEFDTNARDVSQKQFFDLIPRVRWYTFPNAGHMLHLESPELQEKVLQLVGNFLHSDTRSLN